MSVDASSANDTAGTRKTVAMASARVEERNDTW
jgi:hypothetical protein